MNLAETSSSEENLSMWNVEATINKTFTETLSTSVTSSFCSSGSAFPLPVHLSENPSCMSCPIEDLAIKKNNDQIKILRQHVVRKSKKVENFKTLLEELSLKKLLNKEAIESFQVLMATSMGQNTKTDKNTTVDYPKEKRQFAITLHFYSPKAYNYVRDTLINQWSKVCKGPSSTGFVGLYCDLEVVLRLSEQLLYKNSTGFYYLLTYKLSQDHLELFFGAIRSRFVYNPNPKCQQFISAIKGLLLHAEIKIATENVTLLENISILTNNTSGTYMLYIHLYKLIITINLFLRKKNYNMYGLRWH